MVGTSILGLMAKTMYYGAADARRVIAKQCPSLYVNLPFLSNINTVVMMMMMMMMMMIHVDDNHDDDVDDGDVDDDDEHDHDG